MTALAIEVRDLWFAYDASRAQLAGVDLAVGEGEVFCLLGPNGTGKSTLLRCILNLQRGWSGEVAIGGRPAQAMSERERALRVAYVPQHGATGFPYTIADMVVMGRTPHISAFATPSARDRAIARARMEQLGIAHLASLPFNLASGGERQLALIARALVQDAPALVLDEPTASLDFGNQLRILSVIRGLAREGRTVLMTTHSPDHALLCASQAALLHAGHVIAQGAPLDVMTDANLSRLYGVDVVVRQLAVADGHRHVCVPAIPREDHRPAATGARATIQEGQP